MIRRILLCILALSMLFTAGCASSSKSGGLANPPDHSEAEALIGLAKTEALEKLGVSENDCSEHPRMAQAYRTTKTVEFAGLTFDLCLVYNSIESEGTTKEIVDSVQYLAVHEGAPSDYAKAVSTVAKALEKDFDGEDIIHNNRLTRDIPLSELEDASNQLGSRFTVSDRMDISETAPQSIKEHMEYIMTTDFWKNLYWDEVANAPEESGYLCVYLASRFADNSGGIISIAYGVGKRPLSGPITVE